MERKLFFQSSNKTFQVEQFKTAESDFFLSCDYKRIGYIRIRKTCINLEINHAEKLSESEYMELHLLIKKVHDACKKIQTELPNE